MAYQTRCPECEAKLKLEDTPAADEVLECPKCGNQFTSAAASAASRGSAVGSKDVKSDVKKKEKKKDKKGGGEKGEGKKKKKKVKKKKSNKAVMLLMGLGAIAIVSCVIGIGYFVFGRASKMEEIASYVPGDFNLIRGVNVGTISRYPGYLKEMEGQYNVGFREVADELAPAAGFEDGQALCDIAVHARKKAGGLTGQVFVIRTRTSFDVKSLSTKFGNELNADGQTYYKATGSKGMMRNAMIFAPNSRHIVVVTATGPQESILKTCATGPKQKDTMLVSKLGATGRKITAAHLWTMVLANGDLSKYNSDMGALVEKDFKELGEQLKTSKLFGQYVAFGTSVRVGVALECQDKEAAKTVSRSLRDGPLGKGDDSELPNGVKQVTSISSGKEFKSEFLANVDYNYTGECTYAESRVLFAKSAQIIAGFNNPNLTGN